MSNIEEKIARINELYHKSQKEGLTDAEKEEQVKLRREYIDSVKKNLRSQLDNIDIVNKDGSVENLGKKFDAGKTETDSMNAKETLRTEMLKKRKALPLDRRFRSEVLITDRILGHQWYYSATDILVYKSCGSEASTEEIIKDALQHGKECICRRYFPRKTEPWSFTGLPGKHLLQRATAAFWSRLRKILLFIPKKRQRAP